jgi:hypothetical protein
MKVFDFVNSINYSKKDIISESENPELAEKIYDPFLTNRSLSYFIDTVLLANEMNKRHFLDKKQQFDFLLNTVRQNKRFAKWHKKPKEENVHLIMEYYGFSYAKAEEVADIFTSEQLTTIKNRLFKGGKNEF